MKATQMQGLWITVVICIAVIVTQYFMLNTKHCQIIYTNISPDFGPVADKKQLISTEKTITTLSRTIYVITPTYARLQQVAELTRFAQTLMHVPDMVWLVIEDANKTTKAVEDLLKRTGMKYVHLTAPMPEKYKSRTSDIRKRPRGVSNRNRGLQWLRANASSGVFYFADDDNSYDIRIFEEMRATERVSMWPVGLLSRGFSSPILRNGKFDGFYSGWYGNRLFPVDMASFAVSVEFLLQRPNATMPFKAGLEEDGFLRSLLPLKSNEIQLLASNCTEILVWHTQTRTPLQPRSLNLTRYRGTNLVKLYNNHQ